MLPSIKQQTRILFLFADTGGGHRSAAEAIIEALNLEFPDRFKFDMVDFFHDYAPPPLNLAGPTYPAMSKMTTIWEWMFKGSDDPDFMRALYTVIWPYIRFKLYELINDHPCDLMISVHPLINIPMLRGLKRKKIDIPYIIVITDLVSTHAAWYAKDASLIIVPTKQARIRARLAGIDAKKLLTIGLPVADRFCAPIGNRDKLRKELGWSTHLPIVLLMGGGEGMGPLGKVAIQLDNAQLPCALVVITGHNKRLKTRLDNHQWNNPAFIYGFVNEVPAFMRAADIIITKAGPGTISEAFIAGLPIILYHRVPGQEEGNVTYVVDEGAGVWAPRAEDIISTLRLWLENSEQRKLVAETSLSLARPKASREIAQAITRFTTSLNS